MSISSIRKREGYGLVTLFIFLITYLFNSKTKKMANLWFFHLGTKWLLKIYLRVTISKINQASKCNEWVPEGFIWCNSVAWVNNKSSFQQISELTPSQIETNKSLSFQKTEEPQNDISQHTPMCCVLWIIAVVRAIWSWVALKLKPKKAWMGWPLGIRYVQKLMQLETCWFW